VVLRPKGWRWRSEAWVVAPEAGAGAWGAGCGVRGWAWRGVGLRLVRPKRARGRVGRGHRPGCVRATEGPGAGSVRMRDVWACGARVGAVGRAATHLGRGVLRQHHTQAYPLR